jgi:hypothetical protein
MTRYYRGLEFRHGDEDRETKDDSEGGDFRALL